MVVTMHSFSAVIILRALLYYDETGKFSLSLPNPMNVSFDFGLFLRFYLAAVFLPGKFEVLLIDLGYVITSLLLSRHDLFIATHAKAEVGQAIR